MEIKLSPASLPETKANLLALPLFDDAFSKKGGSAALDALDAALGNVLRGAAELESFTGKANQKLVLHTHGKLAASHVVLIGLGNKGKYTTEGLRFAAGVAAKEALRIGGGKVAISLPEAADAADELRAVSEGLTLGAYRFDKWRSEKKDSKKEIKALVVAPAAGKKADLDRALSLGRAIGDAVNAARDLVNEPAMTLTPTALAQRAQKLLEDTGVQVKVHDKKKIEQLQMGMFLGVSQGSAEPPKLIEVRYVPKGQAAAKAKPLALVGKAITFDSGGLSLKPADAMVDMKTDMAGSAAVFAAMHVIATEIKPKFPVYAYVGTCENMPSGTAYRPGDVLTSRIGKTVEITNTDAEGRLVLGDVLSYACEANPRGVIDLATLTGACIVALGMYTVGTFGRDDSLVDAVLDAAKGAGEDFWRMPLVPDVKENLKSDIADMKNSGARWGGAISAAHFLEEFVGETPWVHLDIAGPSTSDKDRGYTTKGGTGVGVRTLVELVRRLDAKA
ncbi:leucyl aminopeptidase [Vulgatibacter incomptus]|uniref:Probable cytosol aminopeptidase n=1 Tax=Vulgatibacter incomptus TaxID=1391653 RepID=A0A0K1PEU9_9BACT|nr:leucyl aminopeptidase [Vulgatibacter incomptus]AKU92058.1 Cytosol aminopeptidase PepA [Vulgatibacter incomptus]